MRAWCREHPTFMRFYVPVVVTANLVFNIGLAVHAWR